MKTYTIECANCGKTFIANKSNAKTCSVNCRVSLSYRKRYGNTVVVGNKDVQQKAVFAHKEDVERSTFIQQNTVSCNALNTLSVADILREYENGRCYLCADLPDKIAHDGVVLSKLGYIDFNEAEKLRGLRNKPERTIWVCSAYPDNKGYTEKMVVYLNTDIPDVSTFNEEYIKAIDSFMPLNAAVFTMKKPFIPYSKGLAAQFLN
jgi:hypothetical protein